MTRLFRWNTPRTTRALAALLVIAPTTAMAWRAAADLTGRWSFSVVTENGTGTPTVVLKQEGTQLTGSYESARMGSRPIEGTVKGDSLRFALKGGEVELTFVGVAVDADHLKGSVDFAGQGGATFTAERAK
jgi:hypothetical protein